MVFELITDLFSRIGTTLGLREVIETYSGTTSTSPNVLALQRRTSIAHNTIEHEELLRAYWMTEMLDSISTIGSKHQLGFLQAPINPLLPCSDWVWSQSDTVIGESPLRPSHYSSAFSLCVMLALSELQTVQTFVRKPVAMDVYEERDAWQSEAQKIDESLTNWRGEFVAGVYRLINAEKTNIERPEMDPFFVLTNCVLNTAVITLLQRRAPCPPGIDTPADSWAFASNRCVYACENMAFKVRQMTESEMLSCNPHLLFSVFVAARFYIVHSKALDADVPVNLHSLAFALHVSGKRWQLARSYENVIRIAVADYRTPIVLSKVPREFYDLTFSTFEIADQLTQWADGLGPDESPAFGTELMST